MRGEDLFHTISRDNQTPITPKSQYKTIWWISLCLGEDDEELVSDLETAKAVWEELKKRYADNKASGRKMLKQYFNFQMTEGTTIDAAWSHLLALGRRIKTAQPKLAAALEPEARIQVLLSGLPDQWSSVRDAIDGQPSLSPDGILSILQEKEVDMPKLPDAQQAFAARAAFSKDLGKKRSSIKYPDKQGLKCKLCIQDNHIMVLCPYLEVAREMVQVLAQSKLITGQKALAMAAYNEESLEEEVD